MGTPELTALRKCWQAAQEAGTVSAGALGLGDDGRMNLQTATSLKERPAVAQRVLVVDDEPEGAYLLTALLSHCDVNVRVAHSGHEAISLAKEHQPQFVLIDLKMPNMTGYELAERLRGDVGLKDVQLIAVSGYEWNQQKLDEAGFNHFLIKPILLQNLQRILGISATGSSRF